MPSAVAMDEKSSSPYVAYRPYSSEHLAQHRIKRTDVVGFQSTEMQAPSRYFKTVDVGFGWSSYECI